MNSDRLNVPMNIPLIGQPDKQKVFQRHPVDDSAYPYVQTLDHVQFNLADGDGNTKQVQGIAEFVSRGMTKLELAAVMIAGHMATLACDENGVIIRGKALLVANAANNLAEDVLAERARRDAGHA